SYFQKSLDWSKLTFGDMIDPRRGFVYQTGDVPRGGSVGNMDFSAGILGFSENFYIGFSAHHLTEPNESLVTGTSPLPMKLSGHAGAVIPLGKVFNQRCNSFSQHYVSLAGNIPAAEHGTLC
ncbi:MAG TPA: type IX secretion system membrane protein PorP/SprF, partial [Flavobacteriales bacterium]|nr:type IX secretion system membrane protein PorP/SprF [Flavobacteriales bacterium]